MFTSIDQVDSGKWVGAYDGERCSPNTRSIGGSSTNVEGSLASLVHTRSVNYCAKKDFLFLGDQVFLSIARYFALFDQKLETIRNNEGSLSFSRQTGTFDLRWVKIKLVTRDNGKRR